MHSRSFIIHYAPLIAFVAYQLGAFHNVPDAVGSSNADHPGNTSSQPSCDIPFEFIPAVLTSFDALAILACGSPRSAIHHRLCRECHSPDVPFQCKLASGRKRACVGFRSQDLYHVLPRLFDIYSAGSNPNADVTTGQPYSTEYRIEYFRPPYYFMTRPSLTGMPQNVDYGQNFTVTVSNPGNATTFKGNH